MRDLRKDWVRWTRIERISAVLIVASLTFVAPTLLVSQINSAAASRNANPIGRSL